MLSDFYKAQHFKPHLINGLKLWLTGDSVSIINNKVDTCFDLSGNFNHAIQNTTSNQPVVVSNSLPNHNSLKFSGSFSHLSFNEISDIRTVFWVIYEDSSSSVQLRPMLGHNSSYDFYRGPGGNMWDQGFTSASILNGNTRVNSLPVNGSNETVPKKFSVISLTTTGNVKADNFSLDRLTPNRCWAGELAELIIYNSLLTANEIDSVEKYLADKYAPPVSLGPDININYGFCDTVVSVANHLKNISWSTGDTTPSISVTKSGKYWVSATDIFGRISSDTVFVNFPLIGYPPDTVLCDGSTEYWNNNLPNSDYTFQWSDGSTTNEIKLFPSVPYFFSAIDSFGCIFYSDTITFSKNLFSSYNLLGSDTILCGPYLLNHASATDSIISLMWSDGSMNNSITVSATGIYSLSATNQYGCVSTDTIMIQIESIPFFSLGNDTIICYNDSILLKPNVSNCNFLWSDNSTDSVLTVHNKGIYWLKTFNNFGCSHYDSIIVFLDTTFKHSSLGADTFLCSGNYIKLNNTNGISGINFLWSDLTTNTSLQIVNSGLYWLNATNSNNCHFTDSIQVTISGSAPTASYTANDACFGSAVQFTNNSSPPPGNSITSYLWDFGDGNTDTTLNSIHTYSDTGIFIIKLNVITNIGCAGSQSGIIHIYPNPVSNFIESGSLCRNTPVFFTDSCSGYGYPITNWLWNFNDPLSGTNNTSANTNTNHLFTSSGQFNVCLTIANSKGCTDTITKAVQILQTPDANFSFNKSCEKEAITFSDSSNFLGMFPQSYFWDFAGEAEDSTISANHIFNDTGSFIISHVIQANNNCFDTITKTVIVNPKPVAGFSFSGICVGDTLLLIDSSHVNPGLITGWNWTSNNQFISNLQNPQLISISTGLQQVSLVAYSDKGCVDTSNELITIYDLPQVNFNFSPSEGIPPLDVYFINGTTGASSYLWDFGDTVQSTAQNPVHQYTDTGNFQITLFVTSPNGCHANLYDSIRIENPRLDVAAVGVETEEIGDFLKITGQFKNEGNVEVNSMELYARVNDGTYLKEEWSGNLPKGGILVHQFSAQPYKEKNESYICIESLKPNLTNDLNPTNNTFCSVTGANNFEVFNLYPNPAESQIYIPINIPINQELKITTYSSKGQTLDETLYNFDSNGLHIVQLDLNKLSNGIYCVKIEFNGKSELKKFIKKGD